MAGAVGVATIQPSATGSSEIAALNRVKTLLGTSPTNAALTDMIVRIQFIHTDQLSRLAAMLPTRDGWVMAGAMTKLPTTPKPASGTLEIAVIRHVKQPHGVIPMNVVSTTILVLIHPYPNPQLSPLAAM